MPNNTKKTSVHISKLAAEIMQDDNASKVAKRLAGSALAQRDGDKQTGAAMEELAGRVLAGNHYAPETKELAASLVSQSNKAR